MYHVQPVLIITLLPAMVVSPSQQDGLLDKAAPVDKLLAVDEAISPPPKWKKKRSILQKESNSKIY